MNLKAFGKNTIIYAIGNIGLRTGSFLLVPLYTHALSVSEYGMLATILLTIQILSVFMGLGTRSAFIRFASEYNEKGSLGALLGSAFFLNIIGGVVITVVSLTLLVPLFSSFLHVENPQKLILFTSLAALAQTIYMQLTTYYRALNKGMTFVIANSAAFLFLIASNMLLVVVFKKGILGVLIAQIFSYGVLWLGLTVSVYFKTRLVVTKESMTELFRFGYPLVFSQSGDLVTDSTALFFLSYFAGLEQVAVYSLGFKIAQIVNIVLILPFQLAYEPIVYGNINKNGIQEFISKSMVFLLIVFAFLTAGIAFIFKDFIHLIAPAEYNKAYMLVFFIFPGIAFTGIYYIAESLLHIRQKTKITGSIIFVVTILSVVFNYLLIPRFGYFGVIVVYNITHMSIALILLIIGLKYFPITLSFKKITFAVFLMVFLLGSLFLLQSQNNYIFYGIFPIIFITSIGLTIGFGIVPIDFIKKKCFASC